MLCPLLHVSALVPPLQPKPQQIHHPKFFSALGAKIIDILNADVRLPSVIPAILSVIPAKAGIHIRRRTDIHNINLGFLKFPKTSLAGFQFSTLSYDCFKHTPQSG